jgi:hypothetical protein
MMDQKAAARRRKAFAQSGPNKGNSVLPVFASRVRRV